MAELDIGPGDLVLTPSGAVARVVRVYEGKERKALVEWPQNGETANFLISVLRPHGSQT